MADIALPRAPRSSRKGVILAGGTGTRLRPLTTVVNKQLLPVYDKPMIYYPLTTLMLGGIRDFVLVSSPSAIGHFEESLGSGASWGIRIEYAVQEKPQGIAQALLAAEQQIDGADCALILGDNIFYGAQLPAQLARVDQRRTGATIFPYYVAAPQSFGVVEMDVDGRAVALHEKPKEFRSNWAVPGLYYYDNRVLDLVHTLSPSARGELEITDLNRAYLERGELHTEILGRGIAWLDSGTHDDLFSAGQLIQALETRTGLKVACPEEVAFRMGYIDLEQLSELSSHYGEGSYADYLRTIVSLEQRAQR